MMMRYFFVFHYCLLMLSASTGHAQQIACSEVSFAFEKQATFEREAFSARLTVRNESSFNMEELRFSIGGRDFLGNRAILTTETDSSTKADFFVFAETMPSGTVEAGEERVFEMVLIPTIWAGKQRPGGMDYLIGGDLSYQIADSSGSTRRISLKEAHILIQPLPELTLDQFLPEQVLGDDPLTLNVVEPTIPFSFISIIRNEGYGAIDSLVVATEQPFITGNALGTPVAIRLTGLRRGENPVESGSLGQVDISLGQAGSGDDIYRIEYFGESNFSGQFTSMNTTVFHAEELGGRLTSLLPQESIRDHFLIGQVRTIGEGRDNLLDVLGRERLSDGSPSKILKLHETDRIPQLVEDLTGHFANGNWSRSADTLRFQLPETESSAYFSMQHPAFAGKVPVAAIAPDGYNIPSTNVWTMPRWDKDSLEWETFLHVFLQGSQAAGELRVVLADAPEPPQPPRFDPVMDQYLNVGDTLNLLIRASSNASPPVLGEIDLPPGAKIETFFTESANSTSWRLSWVPTARDIGTWMPRIKADVDGKAAQLDFAIHVGVDPFDAYLLRYFDALDIDPRWDSDNDGLDVFSEYVLGLDPHAHDAYTRVGFTVREIGDESYFCLWLMLRADAEGFELSVTAIDSLELLSNPRPATELELSAEQFPDNLPDGLIYKEFIFPEPLRDGYENRFLLLNVEPSE